MHATKNLLFTPHVPSFAIPLLANFAIAHQTIRNLNRPTTFITLDTSFPTLARSLTTFTVRLRRFSVTAWATLTTRSDMVGSIGTPAIKAMDWTAEGDAL